MADDDHGQLQEDVHRRHRERARGGLSLRQDSDLSARLAGKLNLLTVQAKTNFSYRKPEI